ncbi:MAG: FkbM family methyltransferase [Alphaproteobacteria bacterium]|nr:FkbM family methyltransferase [Alphaproteobacteria bacterium]
MTLTLQDYERLNPRCTVEVFGSRVTYCTPTARTKWRVDSLFTKEPCTIEWIATFGPQDVLIDIGANVGMYTILAAGARGCRVYAFEPEAQSFALLNKNIFVNNLADRVTAYCLGLSDAAGLVTLNLSDFGAGASSHSLGAEVDHLLRPRPAAYKQGGIAARLDDLVAQNTVPVPSHIKIDVDGFEHRVASGAWATLQRPEVRSLLIEINKNLEEHRKLVDSLVRLGFRYDPGQVARVERPDGPFKGCAEYVFRR